MKSFKTETAAALIRNRRYIYCARKKWEVNRDQIRRRLRWIVIIFAAMTWRKSESVIIFELRTIVEAESSVCSSLVQWQNYCLSWDADDINENSYCLLLIVPTFIAHVFFWVHVCCYNFLHHWSLIWIYNYLMFDMISLIQVLIEYATRRLGRRVISVPPGIEFSALSKLTRIPYVTMVQSLALSLTIFYR